MPNRSHIFPGCAVAAVGHVLLRGLDGALSFPHRRAPAAAAAVAPEVALPLPGAAVVGDGEPGGRRGEAAPVGLGAVSSLLWTIDFSMTRGGLRPVSS